MDASTIAQIISSAGSIAAMVSASIDGFKLFRGRDTDNITITEDFRDRVIVAHKVSLAAPVLPSLESAIRKIPDRYLGRIRDRLVSHDEDYQIIIGDTGTTIIDVKKANDVVGRDVCELLRLIKKHNGEELPDDDPFYEELWITFACEKRSSIFT